mmetsp:Transcript_22885/g.26032  ORF Transcript_22885/g.26032 Transcript_22885/m.26032 type:complete len:228 (-) Transcript_22885:33-716(-)
MYQKAWRGLLLGRRNDYQEYPEIESHLKLLYTGITRSIQRLIFAETIPSSAGDAFKRWSTTQTVNAWNRTQTLVVQQSIHDVEAMTRTKDEWKSAGLDNAIMAEQAGVEPMEADAWLEKALYCFSKGGDEKLARKARTHRKSVEIQISLTKMKTRGGEMSDEESIHLELRSARIIEQLLCEKLIMEARRLTIAMLPIMMRFYSEHQVKSYLLDRFPCEEELDELFLE